MKKKELIIKSIITFVLLCFTVLYFLVKNDVLGENFKNLFQLVNDTSAQAKAVNIVSIIAILAFCIMFADLIVKVSFKNENQTFTTVKLLCGSAIKYVSIIVCILSVLSVLGVDTSTLVTASGVVALIVGLGCQTLVSDIVAGIFLLFEGDIKVGDVVVVNGWRGTVLQIGLRRTKLIDTVGNINIVNNSSISNIINNTKQLSYAICLVGIEYNESIERVEAILAEHLHEFKDHIPAIIEGPFYKGVQELAESSVNIKFVAKCKEDDKFQVERDINREIKILFDKYNINIPFNQIVLNYREEEGGLTATTAEIKKSKEFVKKQKDLSGNVDEQDQ